MATKKTTTQKRRTKVQQVLDLVAELTAEQRDKLGEMGVIVPPGSGTDFEVRWGMRCRRCGKVALEFFGDDIAFHKPIELLPYRIAEGQKQVNRMRPRCPSCGTEVMLANGAPHRRYVIEVKPYTSSRDRAMEQAQSERQPSRFAEDAEPTIGPGANIDLRDEKYARGLDHPDHEAHLQQLEKIAEKTDIQGKPVVGRARD